MNLLLLHPEQRLEGDLWRLSERQAAHVRGILKLAEGDPCRAGLINEGTGSAQIESIKNNEIRVIFKVEYPPIDALPLTLLLALPRPKMLKRLLVDAASLGIKKLVLVNAAKVDKSYWQTPNLKGELLREKLLLGLEQAGDPVMPELILAPRFRPFVEDELDQWAGNGRRLLAHPGPFSDLPRGLSEPATLAIGPEGGWTPFEVALLEQQGFACHRFGSRILRVETALPALVGALMQLP